MGRGKLTIMPPPDEQLAEFRTVLSANPVLLEVLDRAGDLGMPGWYLCAGCIVQTIWNVRTGRPPGEGIKDYDLIYFDDSDLSWEAEDAVIRKGASLFADLPVEVEIRNQARVHLWYEAKFGIPSLVYHSSEDGIDSFPSTTCCVGVRQEEAGRRWRIYAPHGLGDAFNLVVRPNPVQDIAHVYAAKTERWQRQWPSLTILPWRTDA